MIMSKTRTEAVEPVAIAAEGARLNGYLYSPDVAPVRAIVLHPATGVPQSYYSKFARWLTANYQAVVITYDYRDMGESATGPLKDARSNMADWALKDQSAALDLLVSRYPALPVWVVGHSLGGMFASWHDKADRVERIIAVAAGPAHFLKHPPHFIPLVLLFWFALGPITTRLFGYLPGKFSGIGTDLPAEVFWQWRRWCLSKTFHQFEWGSTMPAPELTRFTGSLTLIGISDDVMIPPARVRLQARYYPAATQVEYRQIEPRKVGASGIGHLRVFSERCKAAWPLIIGENASAARRAA
jgi:predicted alpha/beta hydrolase